MASHYALLCVDADDGNPRRLSSIEASTGPQLCGEIARQLGLSSDARVEYWDAGFGHWLPIHPELEGMANRAKIRVPLRVDERVLVGAPAMMSMVGHDEAPVETAADDSRVEMETEVVPVALTDVVACPPSPESLVRDHPGVPKEWIATANRLRSRHEGSFVLLKVPATDEEKKSQPKNGDATIRLLCLDCHSRKLLATGGGRDAQRWSLLNFENSHLNGTRHKGGAGTLSTYDAIVEAVPEEDEPEYFDFVRGLNLRRGGDDA